MTANESTGFSRQERTAPRVTARATRTEDGDVLTEYDVDGRTYHDVDAVERALRDETDARVADIESRMVGSVAYEGALTGGKNV